MRVITVKSNLSTLPLAEIRTDDNTVEFLVDNTQGQISGEVGASYAKLLEYVDQSSHLTLEEPTEPTTHLLRYILSNGDVVEITTDGKTALINGKLLSAEQQQALFGAIRSGQVSVSVKADPSKPVPVLPTPKQEVKVERPDQKEALGTFKSVLLGRQEKMAMAAKGSAEYDAEIENADYSNDPEPEAVKNFWYALKYGSRK